LQDISVIVWKISNSISTWSEMSICNNWSEGAL